MKEINLRNYAYIGDAVWEIFVREKTIFQTENAKKLHQLTTEKVKASFQAELLKNIDNELTEKEQEISRRARNLSIPIARRTNQNEYRHATSFEALIGVWYINDKKRLNDILTVITDKYMIFNKNEG